MAVTDVVTGGETVRGNPNMRACSMAADPYTHIKLVDTVEEFSLSPCKMQGMGGSPQVI